MQLLIFENAWDKTISKQDRDMIETAFKETDHLAIQGLQVTYLRHAVNHKGHLLYMVLLHNYLDADYVFKNKIAELKDKEGNAVTEKFTIPIDIPAHTSMPWTFIFKEPNAALNVDEAVFSL